MVQFAVTHIDGLVLERRNSSALAMELRLSYTNPSIYAPKQPQCIKLIPVWYGKKRNVECYQSMVPLVTTNSTRWFSVYLALGEKIRQFHIQSFPYCVVCNTVLYWIVLRLESNLL